MKPSLHQRAYLSQLLDDKFGKAPDKIWEMTGQLTLDEYRRFLFLIYHQRTEELEKELTSFGII